MFTKDDIDNYLTEKAVVSLDENYVIESTLNKYKEELSQLAEQYNSPRAKLLAEGMDDLNDTVNQSLKEMGGICDKCGKEFNTHDGGTLKDDGTVLCPNCEEQGED